MGLLLFYDTETPPMALQVHESRNLRQARQTASVLTCHVFHNTLPTPSQDYGFV